MERVLTQTGYADMLEAERTIEAQGRIENLEELVNVAAEYDSSEAETHSLAEFLQQVSLRSDADERSDDQGVVTPLYPESGSLFHFPVRRCYAQ